MIKEDRIKFLKMAVSCLRQEGDERPIFSPKVPTKEEIDTIKKSVEAGDIDENLLKKFFPMAYEGVSKYGFFEYFFLVHNKTIGMLERYTKNGLVEWCLAYPSRIVDKKDSKWVVERSDGKRVLSDSEAYPGITVERNLKIGDLVVLHRGKIHMILDREEFEKALKFYNEFKK
jgi:hydrogenase maturation factor